jgi:hypothetical protein
MPRTAAAQPLPQDIVLQIDALMAAAMKFMSPERSEATIRKWLPKRDCDMADIPEERMIAMAADAMLLSVDLQLSQPSASGTTAFDRLAKSRGHASGEATAIAALCQSRFRLLRLEGGAENQSVMARDAVSGEVLCVAAPDMPPLTAGTILFARVVMLGGGLCCLPGAITPLDADAFAMARGHPSAGAAGVAAGARWAEAVCIHVVRHGTMDVPGLNRPAKDAGQDDLLGTADAELLDLAMAWEALANGAPDAALLQRTRQHADLITILDGLAGAVRARDAGVEEIAAAFGRLLLVQLETVQRRGITGSGALTLDAIGRALDDAVANNGWPKRVRQLFETLAKRVTGGRRAEDPGLERLVQRIQGLRAKTIAQGCTEQEALAAAEKVAELLDRYGLSLGELEFRAQPCEGIGIQTNRRRTGPIDNCIPSIAAFFDCRVWAERAEGTPLRYIFFGLRGDVTAAQYLYEMVERAFDTETDAFRAGDLYLQMAGERRSATNSFQIGLAHGIGDKLHSMRTARAAVMRSASGRDLVPVKAAMVDEEMAKLGLSFSSRALGRGKRVFADAFKAGEAAGQRFEFAPAITREA